MDGTVHNMQCSVIVESPQMDRFYMDMRVYRVVQVRLDSAAVDPESLVWRGIYLATDVMSRQGLRRPSLS